MTKVAVVHLVRKRNGIAPVEAFVASYLQHAAGMPHDLVLLFKGFGFGGHTEEYDRLLTNVSHTRLFVADRGFDLSAYFIAVRKLEYPYFCFLNSFSRILAPDWLVSLYRGICANGVGLVGATGSYQSYSSNNLERSRMWSALASGERLRQGAAHVLDAAGPRLIMLRAGAWVLGSLGIWDPGRYFPLFPNYHVRTNAFMASRETLTKIRTWPMLFKFSTQLFESGHNSLTNQILQLGLRALVVSRTGEVFEKEDWHLSNTFRQGLQENLLVADNQTTDYADADSEHRVELSRQTWGLSARPGDGGGSQC